MSLHNKKKFTVIVEQTKDADFTLYNIKVNFHGQALYDL